MTVSSDIVVGDCLEVLRGMESNSVDSCVTDPPYGLEFMGKEWDRGVPGVAYWSEILRVLKPGGHLLSFGGSRTYHRLACAIEDAGFEIRDQIQWIYGSGFPKSLDVSKAIDKAAGAERTEAVGRYQPPAMNKPWNLQNAADKRVVDVFASPRKNLEITAPVTDAARQWQGWGTALKPAHEPIVLARKPLIGTVTDNVLTHGTGAINVDGCRIETNDNLNGGAYAEQGGRAISGSMNPSGMNVPGKTTGREFTQPLGRWPANVIHDGSDEVLAAFPDAKGQQGDLKDQDHQVPQGNAFGQYGPKKGHKKRTDESKSAARFFYCPKASRKDRGEGNNHPTVKPTELMQYLCRLITPPGGIIIDPFMGSGTTGIAAAREGFRFIGIEKNADYAEIASKRMATCSSKTNIG